MEVADMTFTGVGDAVEEGDDQKPYHLTICSITQDQEAAIEAFFQINNWQLIKEGQFDVAGDEPGKHALTMQVTSEQEAALEAFFQINNWVLVKAVQQDIEPQEETEPGQDESEYVKLQETQLAQQFLEKQDVSNDSPLVEEVHGLQEMKVTATDVNGQPQVITVFAEGGNIKGLPQSLLELGVGGHTNKEMSQVIIQEITLPEGMTLDQGLIMANPPHINKRVTPRGSVKPGDKIHKCHLCNKTFKQAQSFNGHYQTHFGAKPFKCDICNTGFTLKAALVAHQSIHTGAKPFVCYVCNKGFRRKDDMMAHLRTHTGEKPYECDICGQKFKYRNQIPKHRRGHTGEKPYACTTCEKRFTSKIHLTRHVRTHTGERPYKCQTCPKAFTQFGHLQAHSRIHSDERPFPCEICGRRFREKKVMKRHELLHSTDRKFKCETCGRGFLRQSNLDLHSVMHQKRPGVRPGRPRPKKRESDAKMREFVANVLSSVRKVDSSMQTDSSAQGVGQLNKNSLVQGVTIPKVGAEHLGTVPADNLSAFVNFAVEQQNSQALQVADEQDLANLTSSDQQITLVMNDDGSGSYLVSNFDGGAVSEEIVNQQVEISTGYTAEAEDGSGSNLGHVKEEEGAGDASDNVAEMAIKTLEKVVYGNNMAGEEQVDYGQALAVNDAAIQQPAETT